MRLAMLVIFLLAQPAVLLQAQEDARWLRDPAISPDGKTIVFTRHGDIYRVDAEGGVAMPVTRTGSVESNPRFSPDGRSIAYSSDRNGTLDVYVLSLEGGSARRLTYHEANDVVAGFSADGDRVLFESVRYAPPGFADDPGQRRPELYEVPVGGGTPKLVTAIDARQASWNSSGKRLLYTDYRGDWFHRKHDDSPFARDIWVLDAESGEHQQLTQNPWNDHTPAWTPDGEGFLFISERSGSLNVWHQVDLADAGSARQLTFHKRHPVRGLSVALDGSFAYGFDGEVYRAFVSDATASKSVQPVPVVLPNVDDGDGLVMADIEGNISEFVLSPNDKEVAFVVRGDVYVTSLDFATTRRITATDGIERNLAFSADGRRLLYAAERMAQWSIYESVLLDEAEPYFYLATRIAESQLIEGAADNADGGRVAATHPLPAPNGELIAYLSDWSEIRVFERQSQQSRSVVSSDENYSAGNDDIHFSWSPDSRYLAADIQPSGRLFFSNIALVAADGSSEPQDLTRSGYVDQAPVWHSGADLIAWKTARFGPRQHGGHGAQLDVYAQFLNQDAYDRFRRDSEEFALAEEALEAEEAENDSKQASADDEESDEEDSQSIDPIEVEWAGAADRQVRLTIHSSDLADFALDSEASRLFYLSAFEDGFDLWSHDFREEQTSKLLALGAGSAAMAITADDSAIIILADGSLSKVALPSEGGGAEPVAIDTRSIVDAGGERRAMLHHVWQTTRDRIYDPAVLAEAQWDSMYQHYATKLSDINNNADFAALLREFIGELNVSHANASVVRTATEPTGALGAILDHRDHSGGILIADVLVSGPLAQASDRVAPGNRIVAVDNKTLTDSVNFFALMRDRAGQRVRLTLADAMGEYDVVLKPVSLGDEVDWRREHWVESRHQLVESLSGGRLGYVYISQMSDRVYRQVYSDLFGRHFSKEGVVIDVRDNRGGDLVNWLVQLFSGQQYMWNAPRGREAQGEPLTQWVKPSLVLTNQLAYSDGHCFVAAWKALDIGTIVGTPLTGTCTYAGWEGLVSGDLRAGTPRLGIKDSSGDWLERKTTDPDVVIYPDPNRISAGEDAMLAKAVEVLLGEIDVQD